MVDTIWVMTLVSKDRFLDREKREEIHRILEQYISLHVQNEYKINYPRSFQRSREHRARDTKKRVKRTVI